MKNYDQPDRPYRIWFRIRQKQCVIELQIPYFDKIHLYVKDPFKSKYQIL